MSLLGRLEDLPITDILQIVYLSRRTGILEVQLAGERRFNVHFQRGLIVGASSTETGDLGEDLLAAGRLSIDQVAMARQVASREPVTPLGTALLELGLISSEELAMAALDRIRRVVEPLVGSDDGEFNFVLLEGADRISVGYAFDLIFPDGGVSPQKLLAKDGERIVPLKALQDQMRAGKVMLSQRGLDVREGRPEVAEAAPAAPAPVPPPPVAEAPPRAALREAETVVRPATQPPAAPPPPRPTTEFAELAPSDDDFDAIGPLPLEETGRAASTSAPVTVLVTGGEEERRQAFEDRAIVLFESDPLVRVAVKRVLAKKGFRVAHFDEPAETLKMIRELIDHERFFVVMLAVPAGLGPEAVAAHDVGALLDYVRKLGRGYPVIALPARQDFALRAALYRAGVDVVLDKPPVGGVPLAQLEAGLSGLGEELAVLAERAHDAWDEAQAPEQGRSPVGPIVELARQERGRRSLSALKHLIADLAGTTEVSEVALMVLRVSGEYLERGVLFLVGGRDFVGLGGFGPTGDGTPMNLRARRIRIPLEEPSVFSDVRKARRAHQGKLRKTDVNQKLILELGTIYPSEVVAIPVMNQDRVLAIVYGDNARDKVPIGKIDGLEIFLAQAGYAFAAALAHGRKRRNTGELATSEVSSSSGGPG